MLPIETHGNLTKFQLPLNTCKDALQCLEKYHPSIGSKSSGAITINEYRIYNHICPRLPINNKDDANNYILCEYEPSRTILARSRPYVHYSKKRFISVRKLLASNHSLILSS